MTTHGIAPARLTVLVTGASTGIGLELARCFAQGGYRLVLVARNRQTLETVAAELAAAHGVPVEVRPTDLASPSAPAELFDELRTAGIEVDVLVNNAGFGSQGAFADADLATQLQMLQVNVVALTHLTGLFLPGMVTRRARQGVERRLDGRLSAGAADGGVLRE